VNLARAFKLCGDREQAAATLNKAAELYRQQLKIAAGRTDLLSEFGTVIDHLALLAFDGDLASALAKSAEAVAVHEECVKLDATSAKYAQRLGASLHNLAVLLGKDGQADAARRRIREAIATQIELTQRHASLASHWRDLADSQSELGLLDCKAGNWVEGRKNFDCARTSLTHLVNFVDSRPVATHQLALASVLANIAKIESQQSGSDSSGDLLIEIRQIVDRVVASGPQSQAIQRQTRELLSDLELLERFNSKHSRDQEAKS
jgi:tetratricopeptide (TPR) repeat protein